MDGVRREEGVVGREGGQEGDFQACGLLWDASVYLFLFKIIYSLFLISLPFTLTTFIHPPAQ